MSTPKELAFERAFPGLRCLEIHISPDSFEWKANGPRELFIQHQLITAAMIDSLPACRMATFGPSPKRGSARFAPIKMQVRITLDGSVTVRQWFCGSDPAADALTVMAFCGRLGIEVPKPEPEAVRRDDSLTGFFVNGAMLKDANEATLADMQERARNIGRKQRPARWVTCGKFIFVDWVGVKVDVLSARRDV